MTLVQMRLYASATTATEVLDVHGGAEVDVEPSADVELSDPHDDDDDDDDDDDNDARSEYERRDGPPPAPKRRMTGAAAARTGAAAAAGGAATAGTVGGGQPRTGAAAAAGGAATAGGEGTAAPVDAPARTPRNNNALAAYHTVAAQVQATITAQHAEAMAVIARTTQENRAMFLEAQRETFAFLRGLLGTAQPAQPQEPAAPGGPPRAFPAARGNPPAPPQDPWNHDADPF